MASSKIRLFGGALLFALMGIAPTLASDIVIVRSDEALTLDPHLLEQNTEQLITDNFYETLMTRTPAGELIPLLAAATPEVVDPTTWRFKLKPSITFTNGEAFNADSVVFSVKRIIDPEYNSGLAGYFSTIADAKKVDDLTVDILTDVPDPILPARMSWLKMLPVEASQNPDFAENPVGTGPYKFDSWTRGVSIDLVRNDDYWGDAPAIGSVTYRFIEDPQTQIAGLIAGEFDLISNLPAEMASAVPQAKVAAGIEQPVFILSATKGITADLRVRQALNYAIDKVTLVETLFAGNATVSDGQLVGPAFFGYDPNTSGYPYDIDRAKALIQEAGVEGETLRVIGRTGTWLKDREMAEAISQMWTEIGLNVELQFPDRATYAKQFSFDKSFRPEALYVSVSNEFLDGDKPLSGYCAREGAGADNDDAELSAIIAAARSEVDAAKREELYHQAIARCRDQAYLAWLVLPYDTYGTSARLVWEPRTDGKQFVKEMSLAE